MPSPPSPRAAGAAHGRGEAGADETPAGGEHSAADAAEALARWDVADASGLVESWWLPRGLELGREIGRGSFGVVCEVRDAGRGAVLAAKRVPLLAPAPSRQLKP